MPAPRPAPPDRHDRPLLVLVLLATAFFGLVLWPLAGALSWAVFLAIVFAALQRRSVEVCRGRKGWAAFGTLVVILVSVILPTVLLTVAVSHEAANFYDRIKSGDVQPGAWLQHAIEASPSWFRQFLGQVGVDDVPGLQRKLLDTLGKSGEALTARAFSIGQNTLDFLINFFVMLYLLYFLLRDGPDLVGRVSAALPLQPLHTRRLLDQFAVVVRATVKGNVVMALAQGALGGLAFWVLGVPGPLLWAAAMALLSLLPAVGAAMVWIPVALWLWSKGEVWQALGLAVWGTLVIGMVDNLLRPLLVGKETRLPDWLVLVSTLGGLTAFGPNGFVLGPVIAAIFLSAWDIYGQARREPSAAQDTT
ncbi:MULTISPECIES: AI-2E family transporter [Ramlibacter]|uniref:AI-2E family transporter n=1 Tax=Ramlibacter aquaticus TaxID=2780094 RepID=A0ABR9SEF3_9BURK|nr:MULTISPECIES: AI-2E family transporter [Ramlibacter]MBE7940681.1 AI-2E family transporter [Ramlibacter aquaticus]